jgi:hypothetical protein
MGFIEVVFPVSFPGIQFQFQESFKLDIRLPMPLH